ncbi:MAG: DUF5131 family protein [Dehalococcoidia bacterium]|nr:DUF5131 family protein [Dehalococcoidia bacterium]
MLTEKQINAGKWWNRAWSLVEGCTRVSPGCDNCWLQAMNKRFHREGPVTFRADRLEIPLKVKKPTIWAIWSDLFHEEISAYQITQAFEVMQACPQHTFIICTKRPERIDPVLYGDEGLWYLGGGDYLPNVILMTTAENQEMADKRITELLKCSPFKLAVSIEPMLSEMDITHYLDPLCRKREPHNDNYECEFSSLNWVIAGCETGPKRRSCNLDWIRSIRDQCAAAGVPLWIKGMELSWSNLFPGRTSISHDMTEWPDDLRLRWLPEGMR